MHHLLTEVETLYRSFLRLGLGRVFKKIKEISAQRKIFLKIGTLNKDIKCKTKFSRQSLETIFCFLLALAPLKLNLFYISCNSKGV